MARTRIATLERERDSLSRMLAEERSHVTELERIIEAARAREAVTAKETTALARANLELREALRRQPRDLLDPDKSTPAATTRSSLREGVGVGGGGSSSPLESYLLSEGEGDESLS